MTRAFLDEYPGGASNSIGTGRSVYILMFLVHIFKNTVTPALLLLAAVNRAVALASYDRWYGKPVTVGDNPGQLAIPPDGGTVYVATGALATTAISTATGKIITVIHEAGGVAGSGRPGLEGQRPRR